MAYSAKLFSAKNPSKPDFLVWSDDFDATICLTMSLLEYKGSWSELWGESEEGERLFDSLQEQNFYPVLKSPAFQNALASYQKLAEEEGFEPPVGFPTAD